MIGERNACWSTEDVETPKSWIACIAEEKSVGVQKAMNKAELHIETRMCRLSLVSDVKVW